nr:type III pantothenate kinase [Pyrinomonadaceae bacterium]
MILTVAIGNSSIKFGIFDKENLVSRFTIPTVRKLNSDEINSQISDKFDSKISAIIISSVVPELREAFQNLGEKFFDVSPFFVDWTFDFGLEIKYFPPENLGIDRIVAAFAAFEKYGKPCIVCDFGTATNIEVINSKGEYLGGTIVAGINLLADALHRRTSKLPLVELAKPEKVIGNSTVSCIQSGIFYGYVGLTEGIIKRMSDELGEKPKVIATGGYANLIAESAEIIEIVDENLMLEGLRLIYEKT